MMIPIYCVKQCGARVANVTPEAVIEDAYAAEWQHDGYAWTCGECLRARRVASGLDELVRRAFPSDTLPPPTLESERHDTIPAPTPIHEGTT